LEGNAFNQRYHEDELRHFFEREGVKVTTAPFLYESDVSLDLGNMLLGRGCVDVEVWHEWLDLLELVIH
jgi:hypothetical protein